MKHLSILGSTGSIGTQALDVAAAHPEEFAVEALAARRSGTKLEEQARRFRPKLVALQDEEEAAQLKKNGWQTPRSAWKLARKGYWPAPPWKDCDTVLNALVGIAGLRPTVAALEAGRQYVGAGQQGEPGVRRRAGDGTGPAKRPADPAGRQRAFGDLPGLGRQAAERGAPFGAHRPQAGLFSAARGRSWLV